VSWGYRVVGDAIADLRELEPWLQEEVLDELERLALQPPSPRPTAAEPEVVHDFERTSGNRRTIVFVRVRIEQSRELLIVLGISAHSGPRP
jgi:hypothetical protein